MKFLLCGACGRMGREVAALTEDVVCGVDRSPSPMPFPVYPDFSGVKEEADVMIDFSSAEQVAERLGWCRRTRTPAVLAATGWKEEDGEEIAACAKEVPVFCTGNLSIGINLLARLAKEAARALSDFDAEIVETHHNRKKDAPSGTALMLEKSLNEGFGGGKEPVFGRSGDCGPRKKKEIGIHAVRGGNVVGKHEVILFGESETVTLAHEAGSRRVFAEGALRAAAWLVGKAPGLYDMDDLLSEKFFR